MAEKGVAKTTKKPVRKTTSKKVVSKTVPTTKRAVRKKTVRKAPTPVAKNKESKRKNNYILITSFILFALILAVSVVVGVTSSGVINIDERILDLKENASDEEIGIIESVPVQKTPIQDGGLVPSGVPIEKSEPEPMASSTNPVATTSDESLISTSTGEVLVGSELGDNKDLPTEINESSTSTESI